MTTYKVGSLLIKHRYNANRIPMGYTPDYYELIGIGHRASGNALYKSGTLNECLKEYESRFDPHPLYIDPEIDPAQENITSIDLDWPENSGLSLKDFKATAPYPLREYQGKIVPKPESNKSNQRTTVHLTMPKSGKKFRLMTYLPLDKQNRMLRIGLGKHEGNWFVRVDLWWFGLRFGGALEDTA